MKNCDEFALACQRAIMEMVIPKLAHYYKEVEFYWPISEHDSGFQAGTLMGPRALDYTISEIKARASDPIALVCFEHTLMIVYNFAHNSFEKFAVDMSDPNVHHKIYKYLEKLIKSTL